jgi:hypothetical protein
MTPDSHEASDANKTALESFDEMNRQAWEMFWGKLGSETNWLMFRDEMRNSPIGRMLAEADNAGK